MTAAVSGIVAFILLCCVASSGAYIPALAARVSRASPLPGLRGGSHRLMCSIKSVQENDEKLAEILRVAELAAREAGEIIKAKTGASVSKTKLSSKDLLTEIDPMCQAIVEQRVREAFPDHKFIGEEGVAPGAAASSEALASVSSSDWLWIVDPIDGTTNFVHQIPFSVVSIGVSHKGKLVAGVVMDPFRDELFSAVTGHGAHMNGSPISCGEEGSIEDATIAAGSPTSMGSINPSLRGVNALMPKCRTIRMFGSAALHLAWIACGRLTAYFEPDLHSWDTAAGAVLVAEAGGKLTGLDGSEFQMSTRAVLASNGKTHSPILKVLQEANVYGMDKGV